MTDITTCSDDKIGGRISTRIEIGAKCFLIDLSRINSLCDTPLHPTDNLILSTVAKGEYNRHLRSARGGFLDRIEEDSSDIRREYPKIPNRFEDNISLLKSFDHRRKFFTQEIIDIINLHFRSFENIFLRECPEARICDSSIETVTYDGLKGLSSLFVSEGDQGRELLSISTIPIHDEANMIHKVSS